MQQAGTSYRTKYKPEYPASFVFDYKDPVTLRLFLMDGGKIAPLRITRLSAAQQRRLKEAIKRARNLALLPQGYEAYDNFQRPAPLSPRGFSLDSSGAKSEAAPASNGRASSGGRSSGANEPEAPPGSVS